MRQPAPDWTRRYCCSCRERLPVAAFDTSRDNPAISLWNFVCTKCESAPQVAIEPVEIEGAEKLLIYDRRGKTIRVQGRQIGEQDGFVVYDGIAVIE